MSIYVVGVPTAGKTTLAHRIKKEFRDVNVISFEAVRNGFIKAVPSWAMNDRNSEARKTILPSFLVELARWNEKLTGNISLVEGSFAAVEDISKLVLSDDVVICLGYGGRSKAEIAKIALGRVTSDNYLFGCSVERFLEHFYDIDELDRRNLAYCQSSSYDYFDTSEGQEAVDRAVLKLLEERIWN